MDGICSRENYCQICPLQFDKNIVYDLHMSLLHKNVSINAQFINDEKAILQENDFSTKPIKEEIDFSIEDSIFANR